VHGGSVPIRIRSIDVQGKAASLSFRRSLIIERTAQVRSRTVLLRAL